MIETLEIKDFKSIKIRILRYSRGD